MNKIANYIVMIAVTTVICPLNVYADEIPIPRCSDIDWNEYYGSVNFRDVTEIPCIMEEGLKWPVASALMRRWFKHNEGSTLILNKSGNDDNHLSYSSLSYDKIKSMSNEVPSVVSYNIENAENDMSKIAYLDKNDNNPGFLDIVNKFSVAGGYFDTITPEQELIKRPCSYKKICSREEMSIRENSMQWVATKAVGNDFSLGYEFIGAFGRANIRLVVNGYISKYNDDNKIVVTLTEGGFYFRDQYDFIGENQPLGCWEKKFPYVSSGVSLSSDEHYSPPTTCYPIINRNFSKLTEDDKYHNYLIYTEIEKFDYPYDKDANTISMDKNRVIFLKRDTEDGNFYVYKPKNNDPIITFMSNDKILKFSYFDRKLISSIYDTNKTIDKSYKRKGGDAVLGTATSDGTHCWPATSDDPYCTRSGVWIKDYRKGERETALIYHPFLNNAYLMSDVFWAYYKMIGGNEKLGPPTTDAYKNGDRYEQYFEHGLLIWSPTPPAGGYTYPEWKITMVTGWGWIYNPFDPSDSTDLFLGKNGGGAGNSTLATEQPASGKLPDFITSKVAMGNQDGNHEKYTWKINETAYVHDWIDNIGDADWEGSAKKIKVPFYLSKGSKKDDSSKWVRIGDRQEIKREHLRVKDKPKHEYIKFKLQDYADNGTVMPGRTYNFVVCADRPKDQDNGDGDVKEKHKSNNCSTEAVFYVDYGPPRNVDLTASNLALTGGRSQLQAGEKYGLQVEIANIGTQQPWNGFSSSYEIKGPGTGGVWQRIGEDTSRASSLYPNAIHFESMSSEQEVAAPMIGGDYLFRVCADYTQAVPETDESNNCTDELPVYIAPPPMPDLITEGLQLTHGRTSLIAGELYGLTVAIRNIGDAAPSSNIRSSYHIKGPGTGGAWQFVADDGSDADQLYPGASQWEEITDEHGAHIPAVPGTYTARACADYQGNAAESDETNNCSEMTFEVNPVPAGSPRIVITNPNSDDDWRSSETDHDFRWDYFDFPTPGHVRIEYSLDGGATWLLVDDETTNDGRKYWEDMCDYHTVDTHHAFVRITSVEYPYVYDISDEFSIDHAAECE